MVSVHTDPGEPIAQAIYREREIIEADRAEYVRQGVEMCQRLVSGMEKLTIAATDCGGCHVLGSLSGNLVAISMRLDALRRHCERWQKALARRNSEEPKS